MVFFYLCILKALGSYIFCIVNKVAVLTALCAAGALGSISVRRAGWLDRLVLYHKNKLFEDLKKLPVIQIKATIEPAPPGYIDSEDWDFESVIRLLTLIRESDEARTVRDAIRRTMRSSRRFMTFAQSFKAFPSLTKDIPNDFYYDVDSGEYDTNAATKSSVDKLEDDDIIVVSNPVEARLPSASISVKLLKSILENRAKAGRHLPTTKRMISWPLLSKKVSGTTKPSNVTQPTESVDSTKSDATPAVTTPKELLEGSTNAAGSETGAPEGTTVAEAL